MYALNEHGEITGGGGPEKAEIVAKFFGVTTRRIYQLTQDGVLPTIETPSGRRYDFIPTVQNYVRYLSDKAKGKSHSDRETELKEQKLTAEIALKESQGELHQLKTAIAAGKYIAVEEVTLDYQRFFVTFKKFAMSLPARLVDGIGDSLDPLEARRLEKTLQREVQSLLTAFVVAGVLELPKKGKTKRA